MVGLINSRLLQVQTGLAAAGLGLLGLAAGYVVGRNTERKRLRRYSRVRNEGYSTDGTAFRFKRSDGGDGNVGKDIERMFSHASRVHTYQE